MNHKCETREQWLMSNHYFCSCSHVEWAHYSNGRCAHCNCTQYNGEPPPLSDFQRSLTTADSDPYGQLRLSVDGVSFDKFIERWVL